MCSQVVNKDQAYVCEFFFGHEYQVVPIKLDEMENVVMDLGESKISCFLKKCGEVGNLMQGGSHPKDGIKILT